MLIIIRLLIKLISNRDDKKLRAFDTTHVLTQHMLLKSQSGIGVSLLVALPKH